jgi:hypothetical protein
MLSQSRRPYELLSTISRSQSLTIESAVMASEIEQLPDFAGYLKLASRPYWMRVALRQLAVERTGSPAISRDGVRHAQPSITNPAVRAHEGPEME